MGLQHFQADDGIAVFDDRHWPIVISTWLGTPDLSVVDAYFDAQAAATARARQEGVRLVVVTDLLDTRYPAAVVRQRIAARADELGSYQDTHAQSFVVLRSAVLRGALTAIQWIVRNGLHVTTVASCEEAFAQAAMTLRRLGEVSPARSLDDYRRPTREG